MIKENQLGINKKEINIMKMSDLKGRTVDKVVVTNMDGAITITLDDGQELQLVTKDYMNYLIDYAIEETKKITTSSLSIESEISRQYEWMKWVRELPFLHFDKDIVVKPIPPFAGAVARLIVAHKNSPENSISIYFDAYDKLGCMGEPYWEIYPHENDTIRFRLTETDEMVKFVNKMLKPKLYSK